MLLIISAVTYKEAAAPVCSLELRGRQGSIDTFNLSCNGMVTVAVKKELAKTSLEGFTGVKLGNCKSAGCLLTFCGPSGAVMLSRLTVSGVSGGPSAPEGAVICSSGSSKITIIEPSVRGNNGTVLLATQASAVTVTGGTFSGNSGGSAVAAIDQASLIIKGTKFFENSTPADGASCLVSGNATAFMEGVIVANNSVTTTATNRAGGAVAVTENAKLWLSHAYIVNNTALPDTGIPGGAAAESNATLLIHNSTFERNEGGAVTVSGRPAKGPAAYGRCTVDIANSTFKDNFRYYWAGGGKCRPWDDQESSKCRLWYVCCRYVLVHLLMMLLYQGILERLGLS